MNIRTQKGQREGISVVELTDRFPDEAAARKWLERLLPAPRAHPAAHEKRIREGLRQSGLARKIDELVVKLLG